MIDPSTQLAHCQESINHTYREQAVLAMLSRSESITSVNQSACIQACMQSDLNLNKLAHALSQFWWYTFSLINLTSQLRTNQMQIIHSRSMQTVAHSSISNPPPEILAQNMGIGELVIIHSCTQDLRISLMPSFLYQHLVLPSIIRLTYDFVPIIKYAFRPCTPNSIPISIQSTWRNMI